jgi:membrane protein implicated in regulation of membrane protease activity
MKHKLTFILEIIWLLVMVAALFAAISKTLKTGFSDSILLYVISGIAALMYGWRRYLRKSLEKNQAKK